MRSPLIAFALLVSTTLRAEAAEAHHPDFEKLIPLLHAQRTGTADHDATLRTSLLEASRTLGPEITLRSIDTLHAAELLPGLAQEIFSNWYTAERPAAETYALTFTPETAAPNSLGLAVSLRYIEILRSHQETLTPAWLDRMSPATQRLLIDHALPLYNGTPSFRDTLLPRIATHLDDPVWHPLLLTAARLHLIDNPIAAFRWAWNLPAAAPIRSDVLREIWHGLGEQFPRIGAQWFRTQASSFIGPPPTPATPPDALSRTSIVAYITGLLNNRKQTYPADILNEIAGTPYHPDLRAELLLQLQKGDPRLLEKVSRDLIPPR